MTERQRQLTNMYFSGMTLEQIATKLGINKSTVSRTIRRALSVKCPFSPNCENCPLPDCAIKEEYAIYLNNTYERLSPKLSQDNIT